MSARLVPVPETVNIAFGVLTTSPLDRDDVVPLPDSGLLRRRGSNPADLDRLASLQHVRLVSRIVTPDRMVDAVCAARNEAHELAAAHDGLVIDLQVPRLLSPTWGAVRPAAEWFAFDYEPDQHDVRTHGLEPIGLPEVVIRNTDPESRTLVDMVVVGLVQRLLHEWPANDPVGPASVTLNDIAAGYEGKSDSLPPSESPRVNLLIDYLPDEHVLDVELMDDPRKVLGSD